MNEAKTGVSKLGGIPGMGTLQVVRSQKGEVLEVTGTWHLPAGQEEQNVGVLRRAQENDEALTYEGKLDDPARPNTDRVELEVRLSSVGIYRVAPASSEGAQAGHRLEIFNFKPVNGPPFGS
ncbi:MAG TPA: hypothetical protein VF171_01865 [Trueperaceae bacterium]